jgi:hypothetical protein
MVPVDSRRIARVLRYSGTYVVCRNFDYRAVTVSGRPFHAVRLSQLATDVGPTTPRDLHLEV